MNFLKAQWEKYKDKSILAKVSDVLFVGLMVMVLIPEGRILLQRAILQTGIFGSSEINEDSMLSSASKQWQLTDLHGTTITLKDLEGQVIFLNFWGTWCPPCNAEMPGIIALMKRTHPQIKFIFASNEPANRVRDHLLRKGWDIPAYIFQIEPGTELDASSLPTTFIIDPTGKIVHRSSGMKQWDTQDAEDLLNGMIR